MKIGDTITCLGPNNTIITGVVVEVEPMKTRSGWNVLIFPRDPLHTCAFILRPEDEGRVWIYGDDEAEKAALIVAEALWERTKRMKPLSLRERLKRAGRLKGTV